MLVYERESNRLYCIVDVTILKNSNANEIYLSIPFSLMLYREKTTATCSQLINRDVEEDEKRQLTDERQETK
jgi:hypothetical protein